MLPNLGLRHRPTACRGRLRGDNPSASRRIYCALLALVTAGGLAACGFHLRGEYNVPFASVFLSTTGASQVADKLRRALANSPTKLMPTATDAEAQLNVSDEKRERIILSLSGAGRVREYQLKLRVRYQLVDNKGGVPIPTSDVQLQRVMTYDDSQVIAKQQEEAMLYKDMEEDAAYQILRRMTAIKR
jgi:LPS-assembly lipoprotein